MSETPQSSKSAEVFTVWMAIGIAIGAGLGAALGRPRSSPSPPAASWSMRQCSAVRSATAVNTAARPRGCAEARSSAPDRTVHGRQETWEDSPEHSADC